MCVPRNGIEILFLRAISQFCPRLSMQEIKQFTGILCCLLEKYIKIRNTAKNIVALMRKAEKMTMWNFKRKS